MPCLPTVAGHLLELSSAALRVHQFSRRKTPRLLALLAAVMPVAASAAVTNYVWDGNAPGGGGNSRWSRGNNWNNNIAPLANNVRGLTNTDLTFAGQFKTIPLMDNNYFARTLIFDSSARSFSLVPQNNEVLTLGVGGIINNSTYTQLIYTSLSLSNSQTWDAAAGDIAIRNLVNLGNNTLTFAGSHLIGITNSIIGPGELVKAGSGTLVLGGAFANFFSGGVTVQNGTVIVAKNNALGTGPLTMEGGTLNLGNFNLGVSSITLSGGVINSASGGLTSSADYLLQAGLVNTRLGGTGGVIKSGSGTVTLTAANTYTGGTQITGGKLVVNNLTGSGTGTGSVFASGGGLLTGTGLISGTFINAPGGSISAGDEVGSFNLGNMIWFGGATNRWDLSDATGAAGVGWDLLNVNGTLTINATSLDKAFIDVFSFTLGGTPGTAVNFDPSQSYLWTILTTTSGINFAPGESVQTVFELLTSNFLNPHSSGQFSVNLSVDGKQLNVSYTPIPEPGKAGLLGLGLCGLVYFRRFKQNWTSSRR